MTTPRRLCQCDRVVNKGGGYTTGDCRLCWRWYQITQGGVIQPTRNRLSQLAPSVATHPKSVRYGIPPNTPATVPPSVPPSVDGPGTELTNLLSSLGLQANNCRCKERAEYMNRIGVAGCKERREEILSWLRDEAKKRKWYEVAWAGVKSVTTGVALSIDPRDPASGLLEIAISRAEAKELAASARLTQLVKAGGEGTEDKDHTSETAP